MPEVVKDAETGILVPPRDDHALADAIVRLLTDQSLRQRMGEAGRSLAYARFSAERMVTDTLAAYERLVRSSVIGIR